LRVTSIFSQQKSESSTITVEGGAQTKDYEINVAEYEANKHFFLAHYFKDNYDRALQNLPVIASGINITRIEVWVTNKSGNFENSRNIVGFMDLAEGNSANIYRDGFVTPGSLAFPSNDANDLYNNMNTNYSGIRNINQISSTLAGIPDFEPIIDYAKIENARLLSPNEYTFHPKLGYISLNSPLNDDEVLAVAYEYTVGGRTYKVGEFSNGGITAPSALILKLVKGPSLQPYIPAWDLMMKNVYSIGSYQINSDDFRLNILYNDDETGTTVNYIDVGGIKGTPLLKVMNLDQLNSQLDPQPDGYFDFIDKLTINASNGRIFFPVREPFGEYLRDKISDETVADKYVFEELYDSTQSKAKQLAEKSKFILKGSYKSAGGSEISLNAFNIPEGSVKVSANGQELVEGTQYLVDYNLGRVTILDQGLLASGTPIKISLENNSLFNINRRTLLGTHLDYVISENFALGGTILHLSEKPLTNKVNIGSEPISNTIWGIDGRYSTEAPFLTRLIDGLPFVETKEMSTIEVSGEFAHLIPGHSKTIGKNGNAYIDDFEGAKTSIDLKAQYEWALASTPKWQTDLFPEGNTDSLSNGFNRAKLAWYNVNTDLLRNTSATPPNVSVNDQSNHFVREVPEKEIFPFKESITGYPTILNVFNVVFYPDERGPYNYDVDRTAYSEGVDSEGKLRAPETRWGGIMRDLQTNDFEAANIEYIEFWMMDPFVYEQNHAGGDLYFNLGYISEDILKDGRKSFENGLPTTSLVELVDTTTWGRVPLQQSLVPAFDNDPTARTYQDIGFDGLNDAEEASFFRDYITRIQSVVTDPTARAKVLQDPSSDNYHFFRGSDYDAEPNFSIMDRYKDFNGPDGNSPTASQSPESYPTSATLMPDVEDINQDNTLNEEEAYFQYHVRLDPNNMDEVGENFITDIIESDVTLKNKQQAKVKWYQFKIPVDEWESKHGPISDFRSIRFVRMFMHGFTDTIVTRFAKLDLVRSDWRDYEGSITEPAEGIGNPQPQVEGFDISVVSIEENGSRTPVNYVLPPGISRVTDPTNPYLVQLNEQSIQFKVTDLSDGEARAAYKNLNLDIRQYGKMEMEVHGERINFEDNLTDDDLSVFIRIGSDYKENYYEVEIPLKLTPHGVYNNELEGDRQLVWPEENRLILDLGLLQRVKQRRNNEMRNPGSNTTISSVFTFPEQIENMRISVIGNPNLSNVKTIMLGVRNPDQQGVYNFSDDDGFAKSGIVWFNELRLTDFKENGGWAANGLVKAKLADLGNVTVSASKSTHGFGSLDSKIEDRQKEDIFQYDISSNIELGKFFPSKHRVRIPVYFGYSENIQTPEYNPLDPDIPLEATFSDSEISAAEKDSIRKIVIDYTRRKSFNVTNLKIEGDPDRLKGKKKRFYHISNFSTSFSYNELYSRNIKTEYNIQRNYAGSFSYVFNNRPKAVEPFKKVKFLNKKAFRLIKDMNFYLGPTLVSFRTDMIRKYQQSLIRDITLENSIIEPTYKKDFTWNRNYDLKYSLTKGLKFEYSATNKARIDEKEGIMDKNSPNYQSMRDTIWDNIMRGGRNINYTHSINASYTIPIDKLPLLGWTSATARYKATFDWTASPQLDSIQLGNTLSNSNTINLSSSLNFSKIYSKVPFLKNISDKMRRGANANKKYKDVKYVKENVRLKEGVGKSIVHNLQTEEVTIKVTDENGKDVEGELVVVNNKKVKFRAKGNVDNANVEVTGKKEIKQNFLKTIGEGLVNIAIGLKNVSLSYSETNGTLLPGYLPTTKYSGLNEFTDDSGVSRWAPGVPFALGWQDDNFGYNAYNKYGWVSKHPLQTNPYQMTHTQNINARASLEPLKGLKIDLSVNRTISKNLNEYDLGNPNEKYFTGNFSMSYLMWNTAFWSFDDDYSSEAFENFKKNRVAVAWRLAEQRNDARLTSSPDYDINQIIIDPETGEAYPNGYGPTSQEVMIPAFLSAYGGRSPDKIDLATFPKFPLPNWRITYDGLSEIDLIKRIIKNINLTHSYNATYNVGSYETNANYNWYDVAYDGYSWARDEVKGLFIPEQQINSITLTEAFNPLIGADVTWINNLSSKFEYNKGRTMTLNFSNNQVIDLINKEIIIGLGYRFDQLPIIIKTGKGQQKFKSDLNLRGDLSIMDQLSILRKVEEGVDQIQGGQKALSLKLSADYALNERFNLRLFYDHAINTPRLSTSYRTSNIKFGVSVRFTLIP
jgi:cell surface protein SprA